MKFYVILLLRLACMSADFLKYFCSKLDLPRITLNLHIEYECRSSQILINNIQDNLSLKIQPMLMNFTTLFYMMMAGG